MYETTYLERYNAGKHHYFLVSVQNQTLEVIRGAFDKKGERIVKSCDSPTRANLDAARCISARLAEGYIHASPVVVDRMAAHPYIERAEVPAEIFGETEASSSKNKKVSKKSTKKKTSKKKTVKKTAGPSTGSWLPAAMGRTWRIGGEGEPAFPEDFEVSQKAVLQVTDIRSNHNKYYAIELHQAGQKFRVFTHYGRTDDLETNPNAGVREGRYFGSFAEAHSAYQRIYQQKTSRRKGYREVNLASSRIGSSKAQGQSSGHIDAQTLARLEQPATAAPRAAKKPSALSPAIQSLVTYLYDEATSALTQTISAQITARGIETPLGVLTLGQIEKGEEILTELYSVFKRKRQRPSDRDRMVALSGDFYTVVPHRIGRSRAAIEQAVINTLQSFEQKQETLQLMKDMLNVSAADARVLFDPEIDRKYQALGCEVIAFNRRSETFREIARLVEGSQIKRRSIRVKNVFGVCRPGERAAFDRAVGNEKLLFHGSRIKNWVGILSRGILLPRIVTSMGVNRTDAGWLGHGIYFGDAACTSVNYTSPGRNKTRFMTVTRVALGRVKPYHKITYGLTEPPRGFHSCHGVRAEGARRSSDFSDDEFVIYRGEQQQIEYLVEFTA